MSYTQKDFVRKIARLLQLMHRGQTIGFSELDAAIREHGFKDPRTIDNYRKLLGKAKAIKPVGNDRFRVRRYA